MSGWFWLVVTLIPGMNDSGDLCYSRVEPVQRPGTYLINCSLRRYFVPNFRPILSTEIFLLFVNISFLRHWTLFVELIWRLIMFPSISLMLSFHSMPPGVLYRVKRLESLWIPTSCRVLLSNYSFNVCYLNMSHITLWSFYPSKSATIILRSLILVSGPRSSIKYGAFMPDLILT